MCMIAHRPLGKNGKGSNIPNAVIETALRRHPDGFGIAFREDGVVRVEKFGPSEADAFRTLLKRVDADQTIEYVAHFRMATHGAKCEKLAHPFTYEDEQEGPVHFFHNGIVSIATPNDGSESDTSVFVDAVISKLPSRWWENDGQRLLVDLAGGWSKFVMMTDTETINLNESDGNWDRGIWYSSDHKPDKTQYGNWQSGKSGKGWESVVSKDYDDDDEDGWEKVRDAYLAEREYESTGISPSLLHTIARRESERFTETAPSGTKAWYHGGHELDVLLYDLDPTHDGDYLDSIMCSMCYTIGDLLIIDGIAYIDLAHEVEPSESEMLLS